MKHIAINVRHEGIDYCSEYMEIGDEKVKELKEKIQTGTEKGFDYLRIRTLNKEYFFNSKQLKNSIISLVYKKEAF